jgi:type II secretory pathway predicted ATPase ExeA
MYEEFYHLKEKPFALSPDPTFLYLGKSHLRAMNILEYGVASDASITVISGEVGTGKTTLIRNLLNELGNEVTIGLITNTQHNFDNLLKWVLLSYGVEPDIDDPIRLYKTFVEFVKSEYEAGRRVVLIIDEAQNLGAEALEDIRMLTNINVGKDLILQLVLVGQPELVELLKQKDLRQFAQRVSADFKLEPLTFRETEQYIKHRLEIVGGDPRLFAQTAFATVYYHSRGIPRIINSICDMALVYGFADGAAKIRKEVVLDAIRDRRIGGLVIRDDLETNPAAEDLRQQIIEKTGVDIADISTPVRRRRSTAET